MIHAILYLCIPYMYAYLYYIYSYTYYMHTHRWWWVYSVMRRECSKIDVLSHNIMALDVASGVSAGLLTTVCMHPIDTIKTRIMTSSSAFTPTGTNPSNPTTSHVSIRKTVLDVLKKEGTKGLWRGLTASMYQSTISSAGFAIMYELIKRYSLTTPPTAHVPPL